MPPLIEPPPKRLLWVDDDGRERFLYEEYLLRKKGWDIIWAHTTKDAARILTQEAVDGIATDHIHPLTGDEPTTWGGYHLIKWLRNDRDDDWGEPKRIPPEIESYRPLDGNKNLPVLIIGAFFDEEVERRIRDLPHADELSWLEKPINVEKLIVFTEALELNKSARQGSPAQHSLVLTFEEIEPAWDAVRRHLARNPNHLHQMDPRQFELLVAQIFRDFGWKVELTSRTRDGGYDIIAIKRDWSSQQRILVEAKRFSPSRKVGVGIVRSLYGVKSSVAASQAILATSSYVTKDARREFARVIPWELDFLERDKILDWCAQADPALLRSGTSDVEK